MSDSAAQSHIDLTDLGAFARRLGATPRAAVSAPIDDAVARELLVTLKHFVHWHDQLQPHDIARAKAVIAKAEEAAR
jgi:hypothetical protein